MASLQIVKGRLSATSEGEIKQKVTSWPWWRLVDENGRDVMIRNVRAHEFMRSHVIGDLEGVYVFTNDAAPWFIGLRYAEDGHTADGWKEWYDHRSGAFPLLIIGLLLMVPAYFAMKLKWAETASAWSALAAIVGVVAAFLGALASLGNLLSRRPSKEMVARALEG